MYINILSILRYDYIAVLDIDEVIVPINHQNWTDLMDEIAGKSPKITSSWNFRNAQFFDEMLQQPSEEIPDYLHMMQHINRTTKYTKPGTKEQIIAVSCREQIGNININPSSGCSLSIA